MHLDRFIRSSIVIIFVIDTYISLFGLRSLDVPTISALSSETIERVVFADRSLIWMVILIIVYVWRQLSRRLNDHDEKLDKTVRLVALDVSRRGTEEIAKDISDS